jgi:hypothetical protein
MTIRALICVLALLLTACASQSRDDYQESRRDPWRDYQPGPRDTYDRTYVPPQQRTAEERFRDAIEYETIRRDDQARIEYHGVFLRDRWHEEANERYQDLMLRNDLRTSLWYEYLDLWEENQDRGDALWYHLRPLILERHGSGPDERRRRPVPEADLERIDELLEQATEHQEQEDFAAALEQIRSALEIAALPELHRLRVTFTDDEGVEALIAEYRRAYQTDPSDGDMLAVYALAVAREDTVEALRLLRDGYVLDLPGFWLTFTLAELAWVQVEALLEYEAEQGELDLDDDRQLLGWVKLADAMWQACLVTRPGHEDSQAGLDAVRSLVESSTEANDGE